MTLTGQIRSLLSGASLYVVLIQPYCVLIYDRLKNKIFLSVCLNCVVTINIT